MFQSDDDDSGNDSDASDQAGKRRRFDEDALEKRRDKRLWTENRNKILFDYTQYCFYGTSVRNGLMNNSKYSTHSKIASD